MYYYFISVAIAQFASIYNSMNAVTENPEPNRNRALAGLIAIYADIGCSVAVLKIIIQGL